MLVDISIIIPLIDQLLLRILIYTIIKTKKASKQKTPSNILKGYSIGCFDISPNETIENHKNTKTRPNAPMADKPADISEVDILQYVLAAF